MLKTAFRSLALTSVLAFMPLAAQAFTVTYQNGNIWGGPGVNGHAGVKINNTTTPTVSGLGVQAGGFALKGNLDGDPLTPVENFTAWCLDIATYMGNNKNYEITDTPFVVPPNAKVLTATQIANIGKLFNTAFGAPTFTLANNTHSAGFQLALWELAYETLTTPFTLASGTFFAWKNATAIAYANGLLGNLNGPTVGKGWNLTFLQSVNLKTGLHDSQNLVTAVQEPLPAAGQMLIGALGGLAALRRRRRMI